MNPGIFFLQFKYFKFPRFGRFVCTPRLMPPRDGEASAESSRLLATAQFFMDMDGSGQAPVRQLSGMTLLTGMTLLRNRTSREGLQPDHWLASAVIIGRCINVSGWLPSTSSATSRLVARRYRAYKLSLATLCAATTA